MIKKMTYTEFRQKLYEEIVGVFPDEYRVSIHTVIKNNDQKLDGLVILKKDRNISPNFYIQAFYEDYLKGRCMDEIIQEIVFTYHTSMEQNEVLDVDMEWENCKDKVCIRLLSQVRNQESLKNRPYIPFMDMAITFYCVMLQEEGTINSVSVTDKILKHWNLDIDTLFSIARENTFNRFSEVVIPMYQMLERLMSDSQAWPELEHSQQTDFLIPYVITNQSGINGATVILYDGILQKLYDTFEGDYYILPSSIHEVLAVPCDCAISKEDLVKMVQEINDTCVRADEVLSDHIYYYNGETEELIQI